MSRYLFSYGTLQPERAPAEIAQIVKQFQLIGSAGIPGVFRDLGDYPGVIVDEGSGSRIPGIVYLLPDDPDILRQLDAYEEYDPADPERSLFVRRLRSVELDNGDVLDCWVYEFNGNHPA